MPFANRSVVTKLTPRQVEINLIKRIVGKGLNFKCREDLQNDPKIV